MYLHFEITILLKGLQGLKCICLPKRMMQDPQAESIMNMEWDYIDCKPWSDNEWLLEE